MGSPIMLAALPLSVLPSAEYLRSPVYVWGADLVGGDPTRRWTEKQGNTLGPPWS